MKRRTSISFFIFCFLSFLFVSEVSGQLITDSDRRLKTQKAKPKSSGGAPSQPSKSPFSAFEKKKRIDRRTATSSRSQSQDWRRPQIRSASADRDHHSFFPESGVTPRYSAGSPFREKRGFSQPASPRYSSPNIWTAKDLTKNPRYSTGKPFDRSNYVRSPRYSVGNIWSSSDLAKSPRYSTGKPFDRSSYQRSPRYSVGKVWSAQDLQKSPRYSSSQIWSKQDLAKSPRYSVGHVWSSKDLNKSPRYSVGNVWSAKDLSKSPRYSVGHVWSSKDLQKSPRYSVGHIWSKKDLNKSPRYSVDMVWSDKYKSTSPRYSVGDPYEGYKFLNVPPKYSSQKNRFVVDKQYAKENKIFELEAPYYTGNLEIDWENTKHMHPSFKHHQANQSSKMVRESMRKWNIFWIRMNGNKEDSKGVKEKVSKPKFDRKEAEIWNE